MTDKENKNIRNIAQEFLDKKDPEKSKIEKVFEEAQAFNNEAVLIIGVSPEGSLYMNTNLPNFQFMQWVLSRAAFELNIHEKERIAEELKKTEST